MLNLTQIVFSASLQLNVLKKALFIIFISLFSLSIISCSKNDSKSSSSTTTDTITTTDTTAPVIAEVTAVTTPTNTATPEYIFSST